MGAKDTETDSVLRGVATAPAISPPPTGLPESGERRTPIPSGTRAPLSNETEGRYTLLRELGRGGLSVVYLAYDTHVGRQIAFKQLLASRQGTSEPNALSVAQARFVREARITAQLDHPGIAPVHEVGHRADGSLYATQKLVRGRTLAEVLGACSSLSDRLSLLQPRLSACQAVAFAHSRGVIHRDLKPANMMVGELGEVVVLDWGLARTADEAPVELPAAPQGTTPPVTSLLESDAARTLEGAVMERPRT
jgi:serine/threonine protein kinase